MVQVIPEFGETFDRIASVWPGWHAVMVLLPAGNPCMLQSFLVSSSLVALAEIGDKTQLLSLLLAARYRKPLPIVLGTLVATLANHALAGGLGNLLSALLSPQILNWAVVASFALMAGWILVPDKLDENEIAKPKNGQGVFIATLLAFFLAEMGDKTQVVTMALAARYHEFYAVVAGTTLGMMLANVPVIYLGSRLAQRIPTQTVHCLAALIFVVLGALALKNALQGADLLH